MATPVPQSPQTPATTTPAPSCKGTCHLLFQYEVGQAIHLDRCQDKIATRPVKIQVQPAHRSPSWFEFDPPPLIVEHDAPPVELGRHRTDPAVTLVLYDFGAVSVSYTLPFSGSLEELVQLSVTLGDLEPLWLKSRQLIERLLQTIGSAVERPHIGEPVEEYLIFQIHELAPQPDAALDEVATLHAATLARILRSELEPLSAQEVQDATSIRVAYAPDDLLLIDWQAAILFGGGGEDVRSVLELASVQLLELRQIDLHLDRALDRAYDVLSARRLFRFGSTARAVTAMGQLQVDAAILFERVNNALKLVGDQYLARVYQQAAQRFRLGQWNAAILRKLDTLESIYQKMSDRAAARRMEALEWIIILLIALSMFLPFLHG